MGSSEEGAATLVVGKMSGVYGIKGWFKVYSWTQPRDNILTYPVWLLGPQKLEFKLEDGKSHGKGIIAKLAGINTPEEAMPYLGMEVSVGVDELPELDEGEFYWRDLLGLRVVNLQKVDFGKVTGFMETGSNDVLIVKGDRERLVPWVREQFVLDVDLESGVITVDWDADF